MVECHLFSPNLNHPFTCASSVLSAAPPASRSSHKDFEHFPAVWVFNGRRFANGKSSQQPDGSDGNNIAATVTNLLLTLLRAGEKVEKNTTKIDKLH